MDSIWLSVIELTPLPQGKLGVAVHARPRTAFEATANSVGLTCMFVEPVGVGHRAQIGTWQIEPLRGQFPTQVERLGDVWIGCLPRLTRAGARLKSLDVDAMVAPSQAGNRENVEGFWFEIAPPECAWKRVTANRVRSVLGNVNKDACFAPFFVHAAGHAEQAGRLLRALGDQTHTDAADI